MTRKRVLMAMAAGLWLLALTSRAQDAPAGVCCNNGVALAPEGQPCVLLHKVGPGENLHILAAYYYGDARAWQRIYAFNKKTIGNPNRIRAGQILRIEVPPCWTPRFDLQEFIRIEEARSVLVNQTTGEHAKVHVSHETVEPKVNLEVETDEGDTSGDQPRRTRPGVRPVAPTSVQIEE